MRRTLLAVLCVSLCSCQGFNVRLGAYGTFDGGKVGGYVEFDPHDSKTIRRPKLTFQDNLSTAVAILDIKDARPIR